MYDGGFRARFSVSFSFLLLSGVLLLIPALGNAVFAKASTANAGIQFSKQLRIGFQSGDDWEPSITADRYGHVYPMYKHYAVAGGQNCPIVSTQPPGLDKDELAVRGNTVVVAYDDNYSTYASVTLDGGQHWQSHLVFPTTQKLNLTLSAGAAIDSRGNFYISWDSYDKAHRKAGQGPVTLWVSKSTDNGQTWTRTIIGVSVGAAPICNPCGFDYLSSQMALRIGSDDTIYLLWNSNVDGINNTPQRIFFSRSTNYGRSYSLPVDISGAPFGAEHCFPAIVVGRSAGDVRIGWMDTRTGAWNVFFRESQDGGIHFSNSVRISSFVPGYPYLTQAGFGLPYGDYFSMAVDVNNKTQIAWGEAPSYAGPGNQWVSHNINN